MNNITGEHQALLEVTLTKKEAFFIQFMVPLYLNDICSCPFICLNLYATLSYTLKVKKVALLGRVSPLRPL